MTPRLPPSRLLLLATPSHDPLSRSPPLAPPFSLSFSRRPSRCLPSAPHLPSPSSCTSFPLAPSLPARPSFSFRFYSLSLSRLLFCRGRRRKTRRDAEFRDSRPRCSVCIRERSNRAPGSDFLPTAWTTFGYVLFLFFSLPLTHSFCLSSSARLTPRLSPARRVRERTRQVCNSVETCL